MKTLYRSVACLCVLALSFASQSNATGVTLIVGAASLPPGATVVSLDEGLPSNFFSSGPNAGIQVQTVLETSREPTNNDDPYLFVGPNSIVAAAFAGGVGYIGFNWGSPDLYNSLTLVNAAGISTVYGQGGTAIPGLLVNQKSTQYVNVFANGSPIVYAAWTSIEPAFEFNDIALAVGSESPDQNPTPEPASMILLIGGLMAIPLAARRGAQTFKLCS